MEHLLLVFVFCLRKPNDFKLCQQNGSHRLRRKYLNTLNWQKNFILALEYLVFQHRSWDTSAVPGHVPGDGRQRWSQHPRTALQGRSWAAARAGCGSGRSSQGSYSARNSYTSCHQPIFRLLSLTGMHWVQPRQNQTCSCLLCPGRWDLRGRKVNAAPRSATSNLVLLSSWWIAAAESWLAPESSSRLLTPVLPVFHKLYELFPSTFCWVWVLILIDVDKILCQYQLLAETAGTRERRDLGKKA